VPGWVLALKVAGMGWYVALCIVLGVLGGFWLDKKVDASPLFMLLGVVLGVVVAFYGVYKMVVPVLETSDVKRHKNKEGTR
jgi:F0F1-type ATP synthase assembly protein I